MISLETAPWTWTAKIETTSGPYNRSLPRSPEIRIKQIKTFRPGSSSPLLQAAFWDH